MAKFTRRTKGSKKSRKSNKSVQGGESWNSGSGQGWNSGSNQGWNSGSSDQGAYITNTYQDQPQVYNVPQEQAQLFNVPQTQVYNVPQAQVYNVPQAQVYNVPQAQLFNVPQTQVYNVPQPQVYNVPQTQVFNVPQTQPQVYNVPQTQPLVTPAQNWSKMANVPQNAPGTQTTNPGVQQKNNDTFKNTTAVLNSPRPRTNDYKPTYVTTPIYNQYSNYGFGYPSYGYSSFGYPSYSSYGYGYPGYSMFGYSPYSGYYGNSFAGVGLGLGLGLGSNYLYGQQYNQPVTVSIGQAGIAAGPSVVINKSNPGLVAGPVAPAQVQQAQVQQGQVQQGQVQQGQVQQGQVQQGQAQQGQVPTEAPPPDYYGILGVSRDATKSDIDKAYTTIKAAMNKNPKKNNAGGLMKTLNTAFNTLSTNAKRKSYNSQVNSWVKAHPPVMNNK